MNAKLQISYYGLPIWTKNILAYCISNTSTSTLTNKQSVQMHKPFIPFPTYSHFSSCIGKKYTTAQNNNKKLLHKFCIKCSITILFFYTN